jgi:Ca2+-binding RTX toxin-like protein
MHSLETHPSVNAPRRSRVVALLCVLLVPLTVGLSATPAGAATCSGTNTMTIDLSSGEAVSISLSGDADPRVIVVTPADPTCTGFDTGTVSSIQVNGADGNETVTVDQAGTAPFPHQNTSTIALALGGGTDALIIQGQAVADTIGFGTGGVSLDAGETPDVSGADSAESISIRANDGDDQVSGSGGGGLGGPFTLGLTIDGGAGNDSVSGGSGNDDLRGGDGDDGLRGRQGEDVVDGGAGEDVLNGGDGSDSVSGAAGVDAVAGGDAADVVSGGDGDDTARGGEGEDAVAGDAGNDFVRGGGGNDDVRGGPQNDQLFGGNGTDHCLGGPGADSMTGCESGRV